MSNELQLREPILQILENLLAYAKGGQVVSLAVVAQFARERTVESFYVDEEHGNLAALNLSLDALKWRLMAGVNGFGEDELPDEADDDDESDY